MTRANVLLFLVGAAALIDCARDDRSSSSAPSSAVVVSAPSAGSVRAISMPHDEPELPPGKGRDAFISACVICHSPRYVTNQPRFSRDVWTEEVHKMMGTFGAPVPPDRVDEIVDYVVAFHGERESQ